MVKVYTVKVLVVNQEKRTTVDILYTILMAMSNVRMETVKIVS